jgi:hypothetical protein
VARHWIAIVAMLTLVFLAVSPAEGGRSTPTACGAQEYAYAGLQSDSTAHGIAATITALRTPTVDDGHVGGWVGVGGVDAGPGGTPDWLQVGLVSFSPDPTVKLYYELTVPGKDTRYVELDSHVAAGEKHQVAVLEMSKRNAWWRVWVDGKPASPPLYLPGSHARNGAWYPQAVAENWNGGTGTCNAYAYRFTDVRLARTNGGVWKPVTRRSLFEDPGYRVVETSRVPSNFVATSLG